MSIKRALLYGGLSLTLVVLGSIGAVFWVFTTPLGTAWLLDRLESIATPTLAIGAAHGTLQRGLTLNDVVVQLESGEARMARIELSWDAVELLNGTIALDALSVTDAHYQVLDSDAGQAVEGDLALPFSVLIRSGSLDRLTILSDESPIEIGPIEFSLAVEGDRLSAREVTTTILGVELQGEGELQLDDAAISAQFVWSSTLNGASFVGAGRISGVWPTLEIHQRLSSPVDLTVDGVVALGEDQRADLQVQWEDLSWQALEGLGSPSGTLRLAGSLEGYEFEGTGTLVLEDIGAQFATSGSGTRGETLTIDTMMLSSVYGSVSASGLVVLDPLSWDLEVEARDIDPSVRFSDWPGALALTGTLRGELDPRPQWALTELVFQGLLREQALSGSGAIAFRAPGSWQLDGLNVSVGANTVSVDGRIDEAFALDVVLLAPQLGALWPEAGGALAVEGRVGGTPTAPELEGIVEARDFSLADYSIDSLAIAGELSLVEDAAVVAAIRAEGVGWQNFRASSISGQISGSTAQHVVEFDVVSGYGSGQLDAEGGWSDGAWTGQVNVLSLEPRAMQGWELTQPTRIELARDRLRIDETCLRQAQASLCGPVRLDAEDGRTELTLSGFELSTLNVFLPEGTSVSGLYDATFTMVGAFNRPQASLKAVGDSTVLSIRENDAPPLEFPIGRIDLDATLSQQTLRIDAGLQGGAGVSIALGAAISDVWAADPTLRMELSGVWTDLGIISLVSPDIGQVSGTATFDIEVSGSLSAPRLQGQARVSDGRVEVPRWGFSIQQIEAVASSSDATQLTFNASGKAGEGQIDVDGVVQLDPRAGWPIQLSVRGDSLQAVRLPEAEILVSPDLTVTTMLPTIQVSGSIQIPHARLLLDEIPAQAAVPSTDTVVHGVKQPTARRPLSVHADLQVRLGEDVTYSGAGLDVSLSGEMNLVYDSGRDAVASGTVDLAGQYSAYGQTLALDRGRLRFVGPVDNPGLDVRAVKRIEAITVGVQLSGTVNAPSTRIFSDPAMSEADALAYLLLGRPLSGLGEQENATLETAALSMGLRQALPVIERVGDTLGLDEFNLQSSGTDAGALMAGKQISPRLYIRYTYGLFNRIGGLLMRLRLNERLSLETRSGDYKAMDLIYTVEKE